MWEDHFDPNHRYRAHVVSVYDGDTITVNVNLGFNIIMNNQKIRLFGINTPEVRGEERPEGLKIKEIVKNMIEGKDIILYTISDKNGNDKTGSFKRYLGIIVTQDGINVNKYLIDNNYAEVFMRKA